MDSSINYASLTHDQQKRLMEYFLSRAFNRFITSQQLSRYLSTADSVKSSLGIQVGELQPPTRDVFSELCQVFTLLSTVQGRDSQSSLALPQFFSSPLNFVTNVTSHAVALKMHKDWKRSNSENIEALVCTKGEEVQIFIQQLADETVKKEQEVAARREWLLPENKETMDYTLDILRSKLNKLKETQSNLLVVDVGETHQLMQKYAGIKAQDSKVSEELESLSLNGALSSDLYSAQSKVEGNRAYLKALNHQIRMLQDFTIDSSGSSVFMH